MKDSSSLISSDRLIDFICKRYSGLIVKSSWGETGLFYNPEHKLANGVYFLTIKDHDGENDKSANLNRPDVYRVSFAISEKVFFEIFGEKPPRPLKRSVVNTGHNFQKLDELMPHPIYAWMNWVQILSPSENSLNNIVKLLDDSYLNVKNKYAKLIK